MGRGITEQDYNRIVNVLTSDEGIAFYNEIIQSEDEYLMEEYSLSEDDIQTIHDECYLDYKDRGIVGCVFDDAYEAGQDYIESCYTVPDFLSNYIDYEKFGEDMCHEDGYLTLEDGRVVRLNY